MGFGAGDDSEPCMYGGRHARLRRGVRVRGADGEWSDALVEWCPRCARAWTDDGRSGMVIDPNGVFVDDDGKDRPGRVEVTRQAIEYLTLWLETDRDDARRNAVAHITDSLVDDNGDYDPEVVPAAITGLLNLAMVFVIKVAVTEGTPQNEVLDRARQLVSELSLSLEPGD